MNRLREITNGIKEDFREGINLVEIAEPVFFLAVVFVLWMIELLLGTSLALAYFGILTSFLPFRGLLFAIEKRRTVREGVWFTAFVVIPALFLLSNKGLELSSQVGFSIPMITAVTLLLYSKFENGPLIVLATSLSFGTMLAMTFEVQNLHVGWWLYAAIISSALAFLENLFADEAPVGGVFDRLQKRLPKRSNRLQKQPKPTKVKKQRRNWLKEVWVWLKSKRPLQPSDLAASATDQDTAAVAKGDTSPVQSASAPDISPPDQGSPDSHLDAMKHLQLVQPIKGDKAEVRAKMAKYLKTIKHTGNRDKEHTNAARYALKFLTNEDIWPKVQQAMLDQGFEPELIAKIQAEDPHALQDMAWKRSKYNDEFAMKLINIAVPLD